MFTLHFNSPVRNPKYFAFKKTLKTNFKLHFRIPRRLPEWIEVRMAFCWRHCYSWLWLLWSRTWWNRVHLWFYNRKYYLSQISCPNTNEHLLFHLKIKGERDGNFKTRDYFCAVYSLIFWNIWLIWIFIRNQD